MVEKLYTQRQVKKYAREYVRHLQHTHNLPIVEAYVFGSYAKNTARNWSDIDVCIISKRFSKTDPLTYLWKRRREIDIDRGIEPVGITPDGFVDNNPVAHEVRKYGVKVY